MSYLGPGFDWGAGGRKPSKIGFGRIDRLKTPDLSIIHDLPDDDPTIMDKRDRVFDVTEIEAAWPLVQHSPPQALRRARMGPADHRSGALRFLLLTASCSSGMTKARWRDDLMNEVWHSHVKNTRGSGTERIDPLPPSRAVIRLLKSLTGF